MNPAHVDHLARALGAARSRRGLLGLLATLPIFGGLFALVDFDDVDAAGRRKRRKKRHKHGKGRGKGKHKRTCKPAAREKTCAGTCGPVKNNCKKTVQCDPCVCTVDIECPSALAPDCVGNQCTCGGEAACAGDPELCCVGECVDINNSHDHCGACGNACGLNQICVEGGCVACDVTCGGTPAECGTALQAAIDAATTDATLYVCPGTYRGGFRNFRSLTVIGAGQGDDASANTILDGQNAQRVLYIDDAFQYVTLRRLRITAGREATFLGGAGILNYASLLTMTDCTVSENHTDFSSTIGLGGAIYNVPFSRLEMTGCTVSNNTLTNREANGEASGAGVHSDGRITMTDCLIRNNTVTAPRSSGAGFFHTTNGATLTNCRITENTLTTPSSGAGGGIAEFSRLGGRGVTLINTYVWNNTAPDCSGNIIGTGCGTAPPV